MSVLLVYPVHKNCQEVEEEYLSCGFRAVAYPGRTLEDTETMSQNCWNPAADQAEEMGLPAVKTVCTRCPERKKCLQQGYLRELIAVEKAEVALCIHKRAEFTGLPELMKGRSYVSIHENPINILRPPVEISELDLIQVQLIIGRILNDPKFLDWFADDLRVDDEGNRYHDEEQAVRRERQYRFCHHLHDLVDALIAELQNATTTTAWSPAATMAKPEGIERTIFLATRLARAHFGGQPWRFLLAAAAGELHSAAIIVHKQYAKGAGQGEPFLVRSLSGFKDNTPSAGATTWFNDATLERDRRQTILRRPVNDMTPVGRIERQKKAVQILRDITRRTSRRIFNNIVRGVLADRPQFERVGLIGHRPHMPAIKELEPGFAQRIVKTTYFGSGEERSSNEWHTTCDLIVIAGTPRVPTATVAGYLVQVGEVAAACNEPRWGTAYWHGLTESGEPVRVKGRAYQDPIWHRGHRDLVRAELVQAIGRGRGILDSGCEVIVLSTEECGLPISDAGMEALNGGSTKILAAIRLLTMENPNKGYLENSIVSTRGVAKATGLSLVRTRELLRGLERRGLVRKVGERGGWALVEAETKEGIQCTA